MRDPNRIPPIIDALEELWVRFPDFRFGQMVSNIYNKYDLFNAEDDIALKTINDIIENGWEVVCK